MKKDARWEAAQLTELDFWEGMARSEHTILRVLADNSEKAYLLRRSLHHGPRVCLEIGAGPFGLGVIGFLPEIPFRIVTDPLRAAPMDSDSFLGQYVRKQRSAMRYVVAIGEEIPVRRESVDLAICCNVIDHTSDPHAILAELYALLKPGGFLFIDVHTFSALGLVKWHLWTKIKHKDEMLVKSHPHRMFEATFRRTLESHGFDLQKLTGHTLLSSCVGQARTSSFLGVKRVR